MLTFKNYVVNKIVIEYTKLFAVCKRRTSCIMDCQVELSVTLAASAVVGKLARNKHVLHKKPIVATREGSSWIMLG
jgi:hypothetical protein